MSDVQKDVSVKLNSRIEKVYEKVVNNKNTSEEVLTSIKDINKAVSMSNSKAEAKIDSLKGEILSEMNVLLGRDVNKEIELLEEIKNKLKKSNEQQVILLDIIKEKEFVKKVDNRIEEKFMN